MNWADNGNWLRTDLEPPRRNNFFHGKLMDAYHFQLETDYGNAKRWLFNRLVLGRGVVCGLDVVPGPGAHEIVITTGVAIDGLGREVIVPADSPPIAIPDHVLAEAKAGQGFVVVGICYHECLDDPTPVLAGNCRSTQPCEPGTIREGYSVVFRADKLDEPEFDCSIKDVLSTNHINYHTMVDVFTQGCPEPPLDKCIPLANIEIDKDKGPNSNCSPCDDINIYVRAIAPTNLLLFEMFLDLIRGQMWMSGTARRGAR